MLTPQEKAICELLSKHTDREIGDQLGISEHTVNFHLRRIFSKFRVRSRTDAALRYLLFKSSDQEHQAFG